MKKTPEEERKALSEKIKALQKRYDELEEKPKLMQRPDLLAEIKKLSFHDYLSLYVEAKKGAPENLDTEISPMNWVLIRPVEAILQEVIDAGTKAL